MILDDWLAAHLDPERIVDTGEPTVGVRATRCLVRTDRRALIAKWFDHDDEFARREIASYRQLAARNVTSVAPLVAIRAERRAIVLESLPGMDLLGALATYPSGQVMSALGDAIAELVVATAPMDLGEGTAHRERNELEKRLPVIERRLLQFGVALNDDERATMLSCCDVPLVPPIALTQGDPAPSNVLFEPGRAWLVDFEYGAPRHALFDLAQWFIRCPLPPACFAVLRERIRMRLVGAGVFASTREFDGALARSCTHAALYMTSWLPIDAAFDCDRPWGGGDWTVRAALTCTAHRMADATASGPLVDVFERLRVSLVERWPEAGTGEIDWQRLVHSNRP